ncbi:hypothetical protein NGTWS0302_13280 [Mycolicibacterium cyprinidarum]|uniref:DUF5302 domain-containing protein n=1 Tax=Mycolicibacterium cyprinidarum TaxID=2860311 RepID=A0ABQ4VDI9_9MYCO|nr:hypothetical protein NGTWS1702_19920 [Mycolicibacterium sp. NGTWSNA01]GJF17079.1 hypothetical protein NGTWS0302_13280 [Mycolicibacterium sp. NGTWS0302]GJF17466.1 hypothetical protein NGTWS1803_35150 [Mycolicibacterium sp. NGTWS1803]
MSGYASAMASKESSEPSESPEDDTKRKFREALERKKSQSAAGSAHRDGGAKQPRTHGPVENRREFRRKSG